MSSLLCKLMNTILGVLGMVTDTVTHALKGVGEIVGDLVEDIGTGVGNIFGSGNLLLYAGLGLGAYLLLSKKDDKPKGSTSVIVPQGSSSPGGSSNLEVGQSNG